MANIDLSSDENSRARILQKADSVAGEVLELSKSVLLVHLRYMDRAIDRLKFKMDLDGFQTDGRYIYYNPKDVLNMYKADKNAVSRALLHMMLHCIFCHHLPDLTRQKPLWNLAADIAVENTINELGLPQLETSRSLQQTTWISELQSKVRLLTAEKIYYYFVKNTPSLQEQDQLKKLFEVDNHEKWFIPPEPPEIQEEADGKSRQHDQKVSGTGQKSGSGNNQPDQNQDSANSDGQQDSMDSYAAGQSFQVQAGSQNPGAASSSFQNSSLNNSRNSSDAGAGSDHKDSNGENGESNPGKGQRLLKSLKDQDSNPDSGKKLVGVGTSEHNSADSGSQAGTGFNSARSQSVGKGNQPESQGSYNSRQDAFSDQNDGENSGKEDFSGIQERFNAIKQRREEEENFWKSVSEEMEVALESFFKSQSMESGSLIQSLKAVNRENWDYTEFLHQFTVSHEVVKVNEDEFDYIYYTLGLHNYGNLPLIEPLEYKEDKRIEEFVIAIDTSGSVSGPQVQKFVQKTWNIIKQEESFFRKINIHIIQCDARVQKDVKITSQEEFDSYIEHMELFGFGGTDFRPVFNYVDELIENKEFKNLKGMIYFTDGYGTFPTSMPRYKTAFVFVEEGYEIPDVPPWAIRLILSPDEIDEKMN